MYNTLPSYRHLEDTIRTWAEGEPAIRALVVVGSRARAYPPADAWSDLDLIFFVTDPQAYARDGSWLDRFGDIWLRVLQDTGAGDPEWLVLFAGGHKVDFLLTTAVPGLAAALQGPVFGEVCRRGVRILFDKEDSGSGQLLAGPARRPLPGAAEFARSIDAFWLGAFRAASMIRRGDLWRARQMMDVELRRRLQAMLAWHARALQVPEQDTWYDGRFLENWADPRAVAALPQLFAAFNRESTAQALRILLRLYAMLAEETAAEWHYPYPVARVNQVQDWIAVMLKDIT